MVNSELASSKEFTLDCVGGSHLIRNLKMEGNWSFLKKSVIKIIDPPACVPACCWPVGRRQMCTPHSCAQIDISAQSLRIPNW